MALTGNQLFKIISRENEKTQKIILDLDIDTKNLQSNIDDVLEKISDQKYEPKKFVDNFQTPLD